MPDSKLSKALFFLLGSLLPLMVLKKWLDPGGGTVSIVLLTATIMTAALLAGFLSGARPFALKPHPARMLAGLFIAYVLVFSFMVLQKYRALTYEMVDLGNMDQAIYNTLHGRMLELTNTAQGRNITRLGFHFEPVYILLAPLLLLADNPLPLLFFQVAVTGLGILAVYRIALLYNSDTRTALLFAALYALYPALHYSVLFDFHGDTLAITPLLFMFLFAKERRPIPLYLALVAALLCKEYAAAVIACFGLWYWLSEKQRLHGLSVFLGASAYFLLVVYRVMPSFNQGALSPLITNNYAALGAGHGFVGMVQTLFAQPSRYISIMLTQVNLENFLWLFLPLGFLSFAGWPVLLIGAPILVKDLLFELNILYHHSALLIPFIFISAILGHARLRQRLGRFRFSPAAFMAVSGLSVILLIGPSPAGHQFWRDLGKYTVSDHDRIILQALKLIPPRSPVTCSGHIAPRLTHRQTCFIFPGPKDMGLVEWAIIDLKEQRSHKGWSPEKEISEAFKRLSADPGFEKRFDSAGVVVFRNRFKAR